MTQDADVRAGRETADHERIYLQPKCCASRDGRMWWCQAPDPKECPDGVPWTEYVRADVVAALREENERLRGAIREASAEHDDQAENWSTLPEADRHHADYHRERADLLRRALNPNSPTESEVRDA